MDVRVVDHPLAAAPQPLGPPGADGRTQGRGRLPEQGVQLHQDAVEQLAALIAKSSNPVIVAGQGVQTERGRALLAEVGRGVYRLDALDPAEITAAERLPDGNSLVAGEWWPAGYDGEPLVSVEVTDERQ